jgi:hypothetical protein
MCISVRAAFYGESLGLTVIRSDRAVLELMIGTSRLIFRSHPEVLQGSHHFAFNIPHNLFREAKTWLAQRIPLIRDRDGRDEFFHETRNAESLYFFDGAGNGAELIARRSLGAEARPPFTPGQLLGMSEIGIGMPDVRAAAMLIQERTKVAPYGQADDTFTPMGTSDGLLILAARGREWYPDTGVLAAYLPLEVTISHQMREYTLISVPEGILLKS